MLLLFCGFPDFYLDAMCDEVSLWKHKVVSTVPLNQVLVYMRSGISVVCLPIFRLYFSSIFFLSCKMYAMDMSWSLFLKILKLWSVLVHNPNGANICLTIHFYRLIFCDNCHLNPSNAEATILEKTSKPCHVGIHWISRWVLSDECPCAWVSVIFQVFCIGQISHQLHKG